MKMKKATLYIDSKDSQKVSVALEANGKKDEISKTTTTWTSQVLLPLIDNLLKKNRITFFQLTGIKVATGPGSFTGIRVGIAIANTLGWLLGIPVNGKRNKFAEPIYQ